MDHSITLSEVSPDSNWPGEREPSRGDVEAANELPEPAWLSDFKKCLMASEDAREVENLMHLDLDLNTSPRKYIYPLTLLSGFPRQLPSEDEITYLKDIFATCSSGHPFIGQLYSSALSQRESVAAPLSLSMSCLASVHARQDPAVAKDLFLAARSLLGAIMEVDNRESRSVDLVLAAALSSIYGAMSSDSDEIWDKAGQTLCTATVIARRMLFHDPRKFRSLRGCPAPTYSGPLIWCLWLTDIVQSLHFDLSVNLFTSRELKTPMPTATLSFDFQTTYHFLLDHRTVDGPFAIKDFSDEDALLLLVALLSDLLYLRHSLGQIVHLGPAPVSSASTESQYNPFAPFSPHMELERIEVVLSLAMDKWDQWFRYMVPPEILALYHYTKMYLWCHDLLSLPPLAGYRGSSTANAVTELLASGISIPDGAVGEAWRVLDCVAASSRPSASTSGSADQGREQDPGRDRLCPIWLPIVVFHAGLVVWAHQRRGHAQGSRQDAYGGSSRILVAFKVELEEMSWPCSVEMAATIGRLIEASARSG